MPAITVDGQSFSIDGHRVWIVSGTVPYFRIPSAEWAERLAQAKHAGLNCIETPVAWSLHEPRPGVFAFDGDLDLPGFVKVAASMGLRCILRVGPFVGEGLDFGGLPWWIAGATGGKVRTGSAEFLQAVARYFGVLCGKVAGLQASARKAGGPILAVQNEHRWLCGSVAQAQAYLGETSRYLRENGITVPILSANDLFASAEGEVEVWSHSEHLHANMRQMRALRPEHPRIVMGLSPCGLAVWGGEERGARAGAREVHRRIAEALAAGAQFNLSPFVGGISFGFGGGRVPGADGGFVSAEPWPGAPVGPRGETDEVYRAVRRIATFASRFGRVFASLDGAYQPAVLSLDAHPLGGKGRTAARGDEPELTCIECRGSAGGVVFVFGAAHGEAKRRRVSVVLGDGSSLPVEMERDAVAWVLLDAHLHGKATLDYCSLNVLGVVGSVLVCFGPAGAPGVLSINGSAFEVIVPEGSQADVSRHDGTTIVVCNEETVDTAWLGDSAVFIGASGLDAKGRPLPHRSHRKILQVSASGATTWLPAGGEPARQGKAEIGPWSACGTDEFVLGTSERFAPIDGPTPMDALGSPRGYGWLRVKVKDGLPRGRAGFFESADRVHVFVGGELADVVGDGPGASGRIVTMGARAGEPLTMLVDSMGRMSEGESLGEAKGVYGHVWRVSPVKAGAPKLEKGGAIEPLRIAGPIFGLEDGDATDPRRPTWKFQHRRKTPVFLRVERSPDPGLLLVNGEVVRVLSRGAEALVRLGPDVLSKGTVTVQIALVGDASAALKALKDAVSFHEGDESLTAKGSWSFAKWEPPAASKFRAVEGKSSALKGRPAWWRAALRLPAGATRSLALDPAGLSKGQVFLNGRNLCRYFVATRTGKTVGPTRPIVLPWSWMKPESAQELLIFDEHGFAPDRIGIAE